MSCASHDDLMLSPPDIIENWNSCILQCRIEDLSTHFAKIEDKRGEKCHFRYPDNFVFSFKQAISAGLMENAGGLHCI